MKSYLSYFKLKFKVGLQYRAAAISGIITQIFFGIINISIYNAFYESGGSNLPMPYYQLVSYTWLIQAFFAIIFTWYKDRDLIELIKSGNLAYELARPQDLYFMWYFKILGERLALFTLRFFPVIVFSLLVPYPFRMGFLFEWDRFILFLFILVISALLMTSITALFHILIIFTLEDKGVVSMVMIMSDVLSGGSIPVPFMPYIFQIVVYILPFRYIFDLPFRLLVGNISINEGLVGIVVQIIWLFIILMLGHKLMKIALNRAVIQGG